MVCCQLTKATTGFPHPRGQTYQSTTVSNNNVDKNHAADSGSQATPPLPPQIEMSEWRGGLTAYTQRETTVNPPLRRGGIIS
jgi:hypothetical protein